jgi:VWFA-related protein
MLESSTILRLLSFLLLLLSLIQSASGIDKQDYVSIAVMVRNHRGEPVSGLTANDFAVEEDGRKYPVDAAWQPPSISRNDQASGSPQSVAIASPHESRPPAQLSQTHLLLLLPPNMELGTRNFMLNSTIRYIGLATQQGWVVAILDPANRFTSYTGDGEKLIKELQHLQKRRDPKQYNARWIEAAGSAIRDLGALPGRHVIILACDLSREELGNDPGNVASVPLNPLLLKVRASMFEADAKRASAELYLIQASGPGTVVPFGEAAVGGKTDLLNPGADIADQLVGANSYLEFMHRNLLAVASSTGGRVEMDMGDALRDAAKDAAGYYELRFRPDPSRLDGAYHHITISVRQPQMRVFSSSYYLAPRPIASTAKLDVPVILDKALASTHQMSGITVKPRAWYFPNRSDAFARVPLAAEIQLDSNQVNAAKTPDSVHVVAALFSEGQRRIIGTSNEILRWGSSSEETGHTNSALRANWHEDLLLPPGAYSLHVAALDDVSGKVGSASWRFLIHPPDPDDELAVSSLLLAKDCTGPQRDDSTRRDLLNPLTWQDCTLQPVSVPSFNQAETVRVLLRLYPGRNLKHFPDSWTATLVVSSSGDLRNLSFPVRIEAGAGAGWAVYTELPLKNLGIGTGDHELTVSISRPGRKALSQRERFSVSSQ